MKEKHGEQEKRVGHVSGRVSTSSVSLARGRAEPEAEPRAAVRRGTQARAQDPLYGSTGPSGFRVPSGGFRVPHPATLTRTQHINCKTKTARRNAKETRSSGLPSPHSGLAEAQRQGQGLRSGPGHPISLLSQDRAASHVTDVHTAHTGTQHQKSYTCITSMLMDRQKRITLSKYGTSTQSDADVGGVWPVPSTGNW